MAHPTVVALLAVAPVVALLCAAGATPPKGRKAKSASVPVQTIVKGDGTVTYERDVAPLVGKYCLNCHTGKEATAGIRLDADKTLADLLKNRSVWERVSQNIASSHMPPKEMPKPTQAERDRITHFLDGTFTKADCKLNDPGRVTMRRLNRAEYNNTVHDLLGVTVRPADSFPSDDVGYGFDNIGDVLSISPLLMEKYLTAAEQVAKAAITTPEESLRPKLFQNHDLTGGTEGEGYAHALMSEGEVGIDYPFTQPGEYEIVVVARAQQAGPDPARMSFRLNGRDVRTVNVTERKFKPQTFSFKVKIVPDGTQRIAVAFLNDYYNNTSTDPALRGDRNLFIDSLEVRPPANAKGVLANVPASQKRLIICDPHTMGRDVCAEKIMTDFARHAYRRPVTKAEVGRLVRVANIAWKDNGSFERGIQLAVEAALVSPNFLFRVETDGKRQLTDYELASRLSYFLWSSMPDDTLFALAAKGQLHRPEVLTAQAKRMLKDPRAKALSDNFAGQWLQLRKLNVVTPSRKQFPMWNDDLRAAMRTETTMFFNGIVQEDRSVLEFLDSDYTYLNETLARHYGNTAVLGDNFRRVALTGGQRGGLLSQGSILTVTSNPTRTSPVKRGKWVLDNLLNTPPPPPPPGVGQLPDDKKQPLTGTLRQRMEQHRKNPVCASCHQRMDPIGFGLENYDAIGRWRVQDGTAAIDSSGTLPDGKSFQGPKELRTILLGKKQLFTRALTEKLLTYALGRGLESYDRCNVDAMAQQVAKQNYRFSAIVATIVQSKPFRERRADTMPPATLVAPAKKLASR